MSKTIKGLVVIFFILLALGIFVFRPAIRKGVENQIEMNFKIAEFNDEMRKIIKRDISSRYQPYSEFYFDYANMSDADKSTELITEKVEKYNVWFDETEKRFFLGELSEYEDRIFSRMERIDVNIGGKQIE